MPRKKYDPFDYPKKNAPRYWPVNIISLVFEGPSIDKSATITEMIDNIKAIDNIFNQRLWENYYWNERFHNNDLIFISTGSGYGIGFNPKMDTKIILSIAVDLYKESVKKIKNIRIGIAKGPSVRYLDENDCLSMYGYGIRTASITMTRAINNQILIHESLAKEIFETISLRSGESLIGPYSSKISFDETINVYNYFKEGEFGNSIDPSCGLNYISDNK